MDFIDLLHDCAPIVDVRTMHALVKTESGFNQFAIGVVGGSLIKQPRSLAEAVATVENLEKLGYYYSVGYGQVNKTNFAHYGLTVRSAFDACKNLQVSAKILNSCYTSALRAKGNEQEALKASFSCYYSGNFTTGFKRDFRGQPSYVEKVIGSALGKVTAIPLVSTERKASTEVSTQKNSGLVQSTSGDVYSENSSAAKSTLIF